ncbi:MAG TPA: glycosyltransferase family 9 protein [Bryobacteraceae bacterium]|nr:glycosyltransferase family 9 protein [Bryobacteraceae bacterium]
MSAVLDELPPGARVLLIRLRSLGDCVLTTPALALLHAHRPDLHIGVMVESRFAAIYDGNPAVHEILPPSSFLAWQFKPRLTINLHGGPASARMTFASRARHRAGFAHFRQQFAYNLKIPRAQQILGEERTVHTAEHVASALFWLGLPRQEIPRACLFTSGHPPIPSPRVVVHPFASAPDKAWPVDRFVSLARWLRDERKLPVTVIGAETDDFVPFNDFDQLRGAELEQVKRLLRSSTLFVGNDSGPAHMAAAFGLPVAVLFGGTDPNVWAPWRTRSETVVAANGLASVPLETVQQAVQRLGDIR